MNIGAIWELYMNSENGLAARRRYETFNCEELVFFYNPILSKHIKPNILDDMAETIYCYGFSELKLPTSEADAINCLHEIASFGVAEENQQVVPPLDYDLLVSLMLPLSYAAFKYAPDFFYPYLYGLRFVDFVEAMSILEISIPAIPPRRDYKARFEYYWEFCKIFSNVRAKYRLSYIETCIFIYDFIPHIKKRESIKLPNPTQCWFIGGLFTPTEAQVDETFWQVNKDTRPGDIMVHYETTPKSSVTTIWRALSNGYVDPFYHYHICSRIGERINIPNISLTELKQDEYFSSFPLVRKNFQGVNGFPMPAQAYNRLLTLLSKKGFDTSELPVLYAPDFKDYEDVTNENDVEEKLLIPLLQALGLEENLDFKRQVGIHVGRGHRVFPDYIVDFKVVDEADEARILIEAKYDMRNRQDVEKAFRQAKSYALNLKSEYIILCDKKQLIIYKRTGNDFNIDNYTVYSWKDIETPDNFNELKIIFTNN